MQGTPEQRLVELETRYMHLERQFEELSGVVARQQTQIDGLLKRLGEALARIGEMGSSPPNDRPPHY
jgi:uncharacterized coiled-coil protein SlyX